MLLISTDMRKTDELSGWLDNLKGVPDNSHSALQTEPAKKHSGRKVGMLTAMTLWSIRIGIVRKTILMPSSEVISEQAFAPTTCSINRFYSTRPVFTTDNWFPIRPRSRGAGLRSTLRPRPPPRNY